MIWEGQNSSNHDCGKFSPTTMVSAKRNKNFSRQVLGFEAKALPVALVNIENELQGRLKILKEQNKLLEAQRIEQRTRFDMEMLKSAGYCHGIENYSRHMEFREPIRRLILYWIISATLMEIIF